MNVKVSTKVLKDGAKMVTARGGGFVFGYRVWQEGKSWRAWPFADRRDGRGLQPQSIKIGGGGSAKRLTTYKTARSAMGFAKMMVRFDAAIHRA